MFDVGDLVVCVDVSTPNYHGLTPISLTLGAHYRVAGSWVGEYGPGVALAGVQPRAGARGFKAFRFRKIDAPDTEVSRLIRACKPVRQGQPA